MALTSSRTFSYVADMRGDLVLTKHLEDIAVVSKFLATVLHHLYTPHD